MQENEFEKEVQQKMDGLKLKPSEQVWQHVADAIVKQKTDRRIFAIVLLCLFITTGAVFFLRNNNSTNKNISEGSANNSTFKNNKESTNLNKNQGKQHVEEEKKSIAKNYDSVSALPNDSKVERGVAIKKEEKEFSQQYKSVKKIAAKSFKNFTRTNKEEVFIHARKGVDRTSRKISVVIKNALTADSVIKEISSSDRAATIVYEKVFPLNDMKIYGPFLNPYNKIAIEIKENNPFAIEEKGYDVKKSPIKKVIPLQQKKQWKIGLNFSVGVSATRNGYLGIISSGNGNTSGAYASADQYSGCVNCANSGVSHRPSTIKPAVGFVLGVFVQKNISNKTAVVIGFNYKMYNSVMMVGSRVDSAVISNSNNYLSQNNIFYRTGINARYKNNFHFLEMPLAVHIKLDKQNKQPLYLNAGISIAQLVATNALQFDTASAKYYRDNSVFNKTQVDISAGLLFALSASEKNPFLIGPAIHFSLNKMAANGLYQSSNYSYFGIQVQKIFGKK